MESADFIRNAAGLYANNVNGADDTTHLIEFYYSLIKKLFAGSGLNLLLSLSD